MEGTSVPVPKYARIGYLTFSQLHQLDKELGFSNYIDPGALHPNVGLGPSAIGNLAQAILDHLGITCQVDCVEFYKEFMKGRAVVKLVSDDPESLKFGFNEFITWKGMRITSLEEQK